MSPPRRDHLFCNNAYAVLTRIETRIEIQTPFKKETLEELLEETDAEETETKILGPKELARINVQDHTTQEDVFFDYYPSSATSLLFFFS